jgi:hypothetical protein
MVSFDIDWSRDHGGTLYVSTRSPGEAFGPPTQLSRTGDVQFDGSLGFDGPSGLASNAAGGAVITWVEDGRARAVLRRPGGTFSSVQQLGAARNTIAWMDDQGDVLVLVVAPDESLYVFTGASGATRLGSPRRLGTVRGNVGELKDQFAATQRKSGFVLAWEDCFGRPVDPRRGKCLHHVVRASVAHTGAHLGTSQTLGKADAPGLRPNLLAGPRGDVLALWSGRRAGAVRAARMAAVATHFSSARVISRSGRAAVSVTAAIGRNGGLVAWNEKEGRALTRVVGAEIDQHGRIGTPFTLAARSETGRLARVRIDDNGAALVLWHSPRSVAQSWWLRSRAPHGAFSRATKLPNLERLKVALDGHGSVLALLLAWPSNQHPTRHPEMCFQGTTELRGAAWEAGRQPAFQTLDDCVWFNGLSLAVNASGQALAAWHRIPAPTVQQGGGVRVSLRSPGAGFSAPSTVADPDGSWPQVALTDNNRALILWGAGTLKATLDDALTG